jgi:hypothetical protein
MWGLFGGNKIGNLIFWLPLVVHVHFVAELEVNIFPIFNTTTLYYCYTFGHSDFLANAHAHNETFLNGNWICIPHKLSAHAQT